MIKSIGRILTRTILPVVRYCIGSCEGEMARVLMISPQVQRPSV